MPAAQAPVRYAAIPWGWAHLQHPDPDVMEIHLMPLSDAGQHAFDTGCRCGVWEDDVGFFIHDAFDGREQYERGMRKPH